MSLTRELLMELELTDDAIARILSAHEAAMDACSQELTSAREEVAAIQAEYTAYQEQVMADQHQEARRAALSGALEKMGANPSAIPLLVDSIQLPEDCWQGDVLVDAAALNTLQGKYAGLFARRTSLPVTKVQPPVDITGALTPADVMRMSAEDINRNWSAVRTALQNH